MGCCSFFRPPDDGLLRLLKNINIYNLTTKLILIPNLSTLSLFLLILVNRDSEFPHLNELKKCGLIRHCNRYCLDLQAMQCRDHFKKTPPKGFRSRRQHQRVGSVPIAMCFLPSPRNLQTLLKVGVLSAPVEFT